MRKIILVVLVLFVLLAGGWFLFFNSTGKKIVFSTPNHIENPAFQAVPLHSPLVIEFHKLKDIVQNVPEKNPMYNELNQSGMLRGLSENIDFLKRLASGNDDLAVLLNKPLIVSANFEGKNEVDFLFLIAMTGSDDRSVIQGAINRYKGGSLTFNKRSYDDVDIVHATGGETDFAYAFQNNIFMISKEAILIEEAIRQANTDNLLTDRDFKNLYPTTSSDALANIYINYESITRFLSSAFNPDIRKGISFLGDFSQWTGLDVNLKSDEVLLDGYSYSNDSVETYINLFKAQQPLKSEMEEVIPANASMFITLQMDNLPTFLEQFEEYTRHHRQFYEREAVLKKIRQDTGTDFASVIQSIGAGQQGIVFTGVDLKEPDRNRFFLLKVKKASDAKEKMADFIEKFENKQRNSTPLPVVSCQIGEGKEYDICAFPYPTIGKTLFGNVFNGVSCNFYTFFGNTLIFGDSEGSLKTYLRDLVGAATLAKDANYLRVREKTGEKSNFHCYLNISRSLGLNNFLLSQPMMDGCKKNEKALRKFFALSWQFSNNNRSILNHVCLKYDPEIKGEPQAVWQSRTDASVADKPQIVLNHKDMANKELVTMDDKNQVYLMNKEGNILWKVQVPEPVLSHVYQPDYFKNQKFQYLFNTRTQLYLLDRTGKNSGKFPVNLATPVSNGVLMVDYDETRDYRFIAVGEDQQVYAFNREGKPLKGWKPFKTGSSVKYPVKYQRLGDTDYLIVSDRTRTYFLDRQGNAKATSNVSFEHSANEPVYNENGRPSIISTDKKGTIYKVYFDGSSEKIEVGKFSAKHFFNAADVNGNGKADFIFADENKLSVFDDAGKKLFVKEFSQAISERPDIYFFPGNTVKIGVVSRDENRVYLLNASGAVAAGFPLVGNTRFLIGTLSPDNKTVSLLVGNNDNLFNYSLD